MLVVNVYVFYATVYYSSQSMPEAGLEAPPRCPPHSRHAAWSSATNHFPLQGRVSADVFGFPESIASFPELVATMIMAASPMETVDAIPFAESLSMPYNWLSTLVQMNVHTHAWS